jgi:hypothetical protein
MKKEVYMKRRGQAAMEFLMTYGWAILAAIIAIGVLAVFGVFSPGQFIGSSAIVNAPFYANAWNVQDVDGGQSIVELELQNNGGETATITAATLTSVSSGSFTTDCSAAAIPPPVPAGDPVVLTFNCGGAATSDLTAGETFKANIAVSYTRGTGTVQLQSTGTITDTVVA